MQPTMGSLYDTRLPVIFSCSWPRQAGRPLTRAGRLRLPRFQGWLTAALGATLRRTVRTGSAADDFLDDGPAKWRRLEREPAQRPVRVQPPAPGC